MVHEYREATTVGAFAWAFVTLSHGREGWLPRTQALGDGLRRELLIPTRSKAPDYPVLMRVTSAVRVARGPGDAVALGKLQPGTVIEVIKSRGDAFQFACGASKRWAQSSSKGLKPLRDLVDEQGRYNDPDGHSSDSGEVRPASGTGSSPHRCAHTRSSVRALAVP